MIDLVTDCISPQTLNLDLNAVIIQLLFVTTQEGILFEASDEINNQTLLAALQASKVFDCLGLEED